MSTDLSDLLPDGHRPKMKAKKIDLSDLIEDQGPPPEPEIFSDPIALELHLCRTVCRCGYFAVVPEGAFVEVKLKKLHTIGIRHYYKEVGSVLIPITSERSTKLAAVPHRQRVREQHVIVCQNCIDDAALYRDSKVETMHEWEVKRPPLYSQAWAQFQLEAAPSRTKLLELIANIETREAYREEKTFSQARVEQIFQKVSRFGEDE